jgi:hypothetical protein
MPIRHPAPRFLGWNTTPGHPTIDVKFFKFDTMKDSTRRYKFKIADFWAIIDDMNEVDWIRLFKRKSVPTTCSRLDTKLPWMSHEWLRVISSPVISSRLESFRRAYFVTGTVKFVISIVELLQ